ncbi:MAG: glucose-6-phosphate isomerase, partial [Alphaproteobacteria bacterium]|nr:glucose-6-phosphate isomerase [Alphaproteobacteria bacterium]
MKRTGKNEGDALSLRSNLPEWTALEEHARAMHDVHIRDLFANNKKRFEEFSLRLNPLLIDFSKQRANKETLEKLCDYARACDLEGWRKKMFDGDVVNHTEKRAALHTALRVGAKAKIIQDGEDIVPEIQAVLQRMNDFSDQIRDEGRFTHIINIGIGGSDLGAYMAYEALKPFTDRDITVHFVSNMDSSHLAEILREVEAKKTLFIVASKSFTTLDTMTNANSASGWLRKELGIDDVGEHFIAISQNVALAKEFGIKEENIFPIWNWVGGRFSLWSAVGLPLCIALGFDRFEAMLDGARAMDEHFRYAELEKNLPVMLGLIGMWNRNFLGHETLAVIPYNQYLHRFPAYMQQLDMESNGKSVDRDQQLIPYATGPIIFGAPGTNAQHSFFQLFHQGTTIAPCEFIASIKNQSPMGDHQVKLLANMFAQSKALMEGQESDDPNKKFDGNRPSTTLLLDSLTPYTLGMLIALYEHKIFVQGILWNINSFDQCGVELGKVLAKQIIP